MGMLEEMRKAQEEGEQRRLAQLAARTPEQVAREEETRRIQIETHSLRTGATHPVEEKIVPVREDRNEVTISDKNEVGTIIEYRGESWLVTHCYEVTGYEVVHEEDEAPEPGWYSELFRVRENHQVIQVIAEQYQEGQAQFTGPFTVKFPDEEYAHDMRNLVYSPQRGLYDKTQA